MSLHDALIYVSSSHLTNFLQNVTLTKFMLSLLDNDDKLFWYLGNEKKIHKKIATIVNREELSSGIISVEVSPKTLRTLKEEMEKLMSC